MKSRKILSLGISLCLMLAMSVSASAADYNFDGVDSAEYYPSTNNDAVYGSAYNYGGNNVVDYEWPELPYRTLPLESPLRTRCFA